MILLRLLADGVIGWAAITLARRRYRAGWKVWVCGVALITASITAASVAAALAQTPSPTAPAGQACRIRGALPDPTCTPGAVLTTDGATVCQVGYTSTVRNVSNATKDAVYAAYGVAQHTAATYEMDHLVPLELGGSNDPANLWPEAVAPYPGFKEKDTVESALHYAVCAGRMPLTDAQRWMAQDWRTVYVEPAS